MILIDNYLKIIRSIKKELDLPLIISLQNTVSSREEKNSLYFLPIRTFKNYIFAGICNGNNNEIRYFLNNSNQLFKYIVE